MHALSLTWPRLLALLALLLLARFVARAQPRPPGNGPTAGASWRRAAPVPARRRFCPVGRGCPGGPHPVPGARGQLPALGAVAREQASEKASYATQ